MADQREIQQAELDKLLRLRALRLAKEAADKDVRLRWSRAGSAWSAAPVSPSAPRLEESRQTEDGKRW
jgi:hypothetical protein